MSADGGDFRHARYGVELIADEPVLEAPQFAQRVGRTLDRVPEHVAHARGIGSERGRDALRQALRDEAHPFEHSSAREVELDVVFEDHVDHREPERRLGAHDADPGQALQVHGERVGDLVLDFLRAVPWPVGEDDDLVVREIRNRVDRRGRHRPPAPHAKADVRRDDQKPVPERQFEKCVDHEPRHSSWRTRTRAPSTPGPVARADTRRL